MAIEMTIVEKTTGGKGTIICVATGTLTKTRNRMTQGDGGMMANEKRE
jgi:hypothetical protein